MLRGELHIGATGWLLLDLAMALAGLLLSLRLGLVLACAGIDVLRRRRAPHPEQAPPQGKWPLVSVVVPAYDEELVLEGTLESILASDYPLLEAVVVDDGSSDGTLALARRLAAAEDRLQVVAQQPNQGKAAALNAGIAAADGEVLVCVDADTLVAQDAIRQLVHTLITSDAAAVASNLKVGNRLRWLNIWQSIEYVIGLNLGRRAQNTLGCITTIPGAAAAFRLEALQAVGGYSSDTPTEDTDLTLALLRSGRRILYQPRAWCFTESPSTLGSLVRQRTRWMYGYWKCLHKHRAAFFRPNLLGWFGMPNLLFLHFLAFPLLMVSLPYLVRITDWTSWSGLGGLLMGLYAIDMSIALAAYLADGEPLRELLHAPLQRLCWPFFLLAVFLRLCGMAVLGRTVVWDKLTRTGALADSLKGGPPRVIGTMEESWPG